MNTFVYRLASITDLVYRILVFAIHKALYGLQNSHKTLCGSYLSFCCPQNCLPGFEMHRGSGWVSNDKTAGRPFCTAEGCPKGWTQGGVQ
jgi:hypothetical protein